jgi:hypothetical protein
MSEVKLTYLLMKNRNIHHPFSARSRGLTKSCSSPDRLPLLQDLAVVNSGVEVARIHVAETLSARNHDTCVQVIIESRSGPVACQQALAGEDVLPDILSVAEGDQQVRVLDLDELAVQVSAWFRCLS